MIRTQPRPRHRRFLGTLLSRRCFSASPSRWEVKELSELPSRIHPKFHETRDNDLLTLQWPSPPRNILLTKKNNTPHITESVIEFAKHIHSSYPGVSVIAEPQTAAEIHGSVPFPVYSAPFLKSRTELLRLFHEKVDLVSTLGGDGTILHASSLFATSKSVPPILSFSMGTLGFLGEWKFREYKQAFRETYMSGASISAGYSPALMDDVVDAADSAAFEPNCKDTTPHEQPAAPTGWSSIRGKSLGKTRGARILLRNRLKVGVFDSSGQRVQGVSGTADDMYAMNEVIIHRGGDPHLSIIDVYIGGRFLTEAVADGMIVSTPTGSTAYSLSSGGSIVHPLVSSLLLTPVCPRSLSFRPLVLPANTPITLRLSEKNRSHSVDVSIDGIRRNHGLKLGMEVRVWGENIQDKDGNWIGGVPSIVRGAVGGAEVNGDDHWVGGLNSLLKFNYPFGEEN